MTTSTEVDAYLAGVPEPARGTLEGLRALIRRLVPDAVEGFSYGIPGYKYRGRPLAYFGAAKKHCALYALDAALAEAAGYDTSKGTIRFPADAPPSEALIKELLEQRMASIETDEEAKKQRRRKTPG
jgi:uncharacterized protein YdhG (YjbR/CyaY superfamily)